jgi:hypothetical protein
MFPTQHDYVPLLMAERERALHESARRRQYPPRRSRRSIRRVIGRSMVRIGSRLATDPIPQPARSR